MISIRWLSLEGCPDGFISYCRAMLDRAESHRADAFRFDVDRAAFVVAHALLRCMLSAQTGLHPSAWRFVQGAHGKPAITPGLAEPTLQFSLSHTRGLVACAVAHQLEVGVDVEASDRSDRDYALVLSSFSAEEVRSIAEAPAELRAERFFRLWTLKEAFLKATGVGLSRPLNSFAFSLDPVRLRFSREHPYGDKDDPSEWQFAEFRPARNRLLALAARSAGIGVELDAAGLDQHIGCQHQAMPLCPRCMLRVRAELGAQC